MVGAEIGSIPASDLQVLALEEPWMACGRVFGVFDAYDGLVHVLEVMLLHFLSR